MLARKVHNPENGFTNLNDKIDTLRGVYKYIMRFDGYQKYFLDFEVNETDFVVIYLIVDDENNKLQIVPIFNISCSDENQINIVRMIRDSFTYV